ncbi:MAG TPA: hypothetical protein VF490_19290 [Chryseosolibacter sp.]
MKTLSDRQLLIIEIFIAVVFCFAPLLYNNPYRLNIFLSWEGAYRLYLGQVPFRDFSLPMGYGYWVIPALFFKLFGPFMYSLIKAQVFINLVSVLALRAILKMLNTNPVVILLTVLVFCFSYVSKNFWPWYNHSVIVFEIVALYFLFLAVLKARGWKRTISLALSAFFVLFAIFTKQDAGALTLVICYFILAYDAWTERSHKRWLTFTAFFVGFVLLAVLPLLKYDFLYWFNYGQAPHDSRLVLHDFLDHIVGWSYWEKFFLFIMVLIILDKMRTPRLFIQNKQEFLFTFLCLAILVEALIIQVTSDEPPYGEDFFYAFGFAFVFVHLQIFLDLRRWYYLGLCVVMTCFWWTGIYWRNIKRVVAKKPVAVAQMESESRYHYRLAKEFRTMDRLYLADSTIEGINRIRQLDVVKNKKDLKVLNMSELTSLAYELPFTPLKNQPMWFHQTVSVFQKQVDEFCEKIRRREYDLVLFESIPVKEVINFYPEDVKKCLLENYKLEFTFLAPRTPAESYIHVFTKPG